MKNATAFESDMGADQRGAFDIGPRIKCKPSRFNAHTTAPDGSIILYNTYSGHCCVFPPKGTASVRRYLSQRGFEGTLDQVGEYLLKAGYLVEEGENELMNWDLAYGVQHFRQDCLSLILLASEECNFRCTYCSQTFRRGTMLPFVRKGIKRWVDTGISKLRILQATWFGGEPMLGYEVIEDLAPYLQEVAKANNVRYSSGITTNGYLLTSERVRKMLEWGILSYQVTLDGLPETHNKTRPLKDGGATFDNIIKNLNAMRQFQQAFEVRMRVNFDRENIDQLVPFFHLLKDRLGGDSRFKVAFQAVGRWGSQNDAKLEVFTRDILERQAVLRRQARGIGLPTESAMAFVRSGSMLCRATRADGFVVGADGRIMKCTNHGVMSEDRNVIGQIHEDGTFEIDHHKNSRWILPYYNHDPKCKRCFYLPLCGGGMVCPAARVQGREPACREERMHIRSLLLEYWAERQTGDTGQAVRLMYRSQPSRSRSLDSP